MISLKETVELVKEKKDYYNALERNGFRLPSYKCSIITRLFLSGVQLGQIYCPKYNDLILRSCVSPPPADDVKGELVRLLNEGSQQLDPQQRSPYLSLAAVLMTKDADRTWMLETLSTLTRGAHHFFSKDYVAPKKQRLNGFQDIMIENRDNFFTGLPKSSSKSKRSSMMMVPVLQREQMKLERLQLMHQRQAQAVLIQQQRIQTLDAQNPFQHPHHVAVDVPVAQPVHSDDSADDADEERKEERPFSTDISKEERAFGTNISNHVSGMAARARARHAKMQRHPNVIQNENQEMF